MNYYNYFKQDNVPHTQVFFNRVLSDPQQAKEESFYGWLHSILPETKTSTTQNSLYSSTAPKSSTSTDFSKYKKPTTSNLNGNIIFKNGVTADGLSEVLKGFLELAASKGYKLRITAGLANTGHASNSYHKSGNAIDFTPHDRSSALEWEKLGRILREDSDLARYAEENGILLADERNNTNPNWTGAHYHLYVKNKEQA